MSKVLVSDVPNALTIHEAFQDLVTTYSSAKHYATQLHDDLMKWRTPALTQWLRTYAPLLIGYFAFGVLVYGPAHLEGRAVHAHAHRSGAQPSCPTPDQHQ